MLTELETGFRFNDAVLRHLTVAQEQGRDRRRRSMMKTVEREEARKAAAGGRRLNDGCRGAPAARMNRLVLTRLLVERGALRYTPAGLPALDLGLEARVEVSEAGQPRKVSMEIKAVAIGAITRARSRRWRSAAAGRFARLPRPPSATAAASCSTSRRSTAVKHSN